MSFCHRIVLIGWVIESGLLCFSSCQPCAVAKSLGRMVPGGWVVRNRTQVVDCWSTERASSRLMRSRAMVWYIRWRSG